jgi:hypothetical protein
MHDAKSNLYSSDNTMAFSSVSEQSSKVGTKLLGNGVVRLLVMSLHPTVSEYLLRMDLQYLVWSKIISKQANCMMQVAK